MPGTEFKNQVDNLMNILFGAGVASHATIIEQINYLVFLRSLSKKDDSAMILDSSAEKIFSGELAKYHWDNLLVLNAEVLFTTLEEIFRKLPELATDQTIRLLFRDAHVKIFDKPTLRRLVHEIEKMMSDLEKEATSGRTDIFGDMYEYLLSKLSQSGTLGSFRTPRHIIKFIVDIIDPNKGETILDPACGTAGFLVSALEHLKDKYTSEELKKEGRLVMDKLSTGERDFVYQNTFTGFDSDFDMFKFGLMNLYLHKLEHPNIKRQNTLVDTAGDRTKWDIILANPPFAGALDQDSVSEDLRMNTRATEVLFLKYIIDHLSQNGRAGVIVPGGVVFNSTSAHKKIRQILVEDAGLWCVVSLPSGVFNPYAGVKTSILLFDKTKKNKNEQILFVKIENDGFDLGAQRKPILYNDLPLALEAITLFYKHIESNETYSKGGWPEGKYNIDTYPNCQFVSKDNIIESGNYLLSGDKYKISQELNDKWPIVELGEVLDYEQPTKYIVSSTDYSDEYKTPVLTAGKTFILGHTNETTGIFENDLPVIIFDDFTTASKYVDFSFKVKSSAMKILHAKHDLADTKYIYYVTQGIKFNQGEHKRYWISEYSKIKIPLPPLEIQKQIVVELDSYQKIINGAKQVVESWKPKVDINPEWQKKKLGKIFKITSGKFLPKTNQRNGEFLVYGGNGITGSHDKFLLEKPTLIIGRVGEYCGAVHITKPKSWVTDNALYVSSYLLDCNQDFLALALETLDLNSHAKKGGQPSISQSTIYELFVHLPDLKIQKQIVEKIELERQLVESTNILIEIYQQKIKEKINSIWEDEKA